MGSRQVALDWRAGVTRVHGYPNATHAGARQSGCKCRGARAGPVTVTGRMSGGQVSVCVLDRGAGLVRPRLDVRPRSWQARRGHGLVVARHAVELHGGTLRPVRGPLGSGIEVRLPAGAGPAPGKLPARLPFPRSGSGAALRRRRAAPPCSARRRSARPGRFSGGPYAGEIEICIGPLMPVVVAARDIPRRDRHHPGSHRRRWPNGRSRSGSRHRARSPRRPMWSNSKLLPP